MKTLYALLLILLLCKGVIAQGDSLYQNQVLSQTDIKILFSYYAQDGQHSAVTGGAGTEKLSVYAPDFSLTSVIDTAHKIVFNGGVDVITSASTDRIDYYMSSASLTDARFHGSLGYSYTEKNSGVEAGAAGNFSLESDYTSEGAELWLNWYDKNTMRLLGLNFQMFFDDLRWGRFDPDYKMPIRLVYPAELRYKEWMSGYRRTSFNWNLSYTQPLGRRVNIGAAATFSWQRGLLSTPFHRVYFSDSTEAVEKLPSQRFKVPLSLSVNVFIGKRFILRNYYRFYWDNFGIVANTVNVEASVKATAFLTLSPFFRIHHQYGSRYFNTYGAHSAAEEYFTCDYDLSTFYSLQPGLGVRFAPYYVFKNSRATFNEFSLRYSYYRRSDGLYAHMISSMIDLQVQGYKRRAR